MSRGKSEIIITCHNEFISINGNTFYRELTPFLEPINDIYIHESK